MKPCRSPFRLRLHSRLFAVAAVVAGLVLGAMPQSLAQEVTVIRGGTVIDGTGKAPIPNAVIVIRGDRIEAIGSGVTPPAGARVIEAAGKNILPGLWDKHLPYKPSIT